ncbi:transposase, partial [Anaerostipes hadrus]
MALIQNIERYEFQNIDHVHVMFRAQLRTELSKFINAYKSASSRH